MKYTNRSLAVSSTKFHLSSVWITPHEVVSIHWTPHHILSVLQQDAVRIAFIPLQQDVSWSPLSNLSEHGITHLEAQWFIVDSTCIDTVHQFLSVQVPSDKHKSTFSRLISPAQIGK